MLLLLYLMPLLSRLCLEVKATLSVPLNTHICIQVILLSAYYFYWMYESSIFGHMFISLSTHFWKNYASYRSFSNFDWNFSMKLWIKNFFIFRGIRNRSQKDRSDLSCKGNLIALLLLSLSCSMRSTESRRDQTAQFQPSLVLALSVSFGWCTQVFYRM